MLLAVQKMGLFCSKTFSIHLMGDNNTFGNCVRVRVKIRRKTNWMNFNWAFGECVRDTIFQVYGRGRGASEGGEMWNFYSVLRYNIIHTSYSAQYYEQCTLLYLFAIFIAYSVCVLAFFAMLVVVAVVFLFHLNVVRLHNEKICFHVNYAVAVCGLFFAPETIQIQQQTNKQII